MGDRTVVRAALIATSAFVLAALAGCQTPYVSGHAKPDALMAELQAESAASATAANAISIAGAMDPSGMGAGAAHAVNRTMLRAHDARVNSGLQARVMAEETAVMKCIEESKALSGKAAEDYAIACSKRARGL
jgi:hypothetical protein